MSATIATFERLKSKGIAAFKGGDYATARSYLVDAAECMIELAESAKTAEARRQHEALAEELVSLAKECDARRTHPQGAPRVRQREKDEENGADASDWVVRERPTIGFDDIAGLEDVKTEIRLKMIYPFAHPELAAKYGITVGGGILLYGPPGTGKTMIAKAIAREIDATFFLISPAQIMSKWVGEAEQNIKTLFDAAKAETPSVIFIDEVEALVPRRKSDASTVMQRVVPQVLQELEGFDRKSDRALLFVGATNKPWLIDEAMLRPGRLDAKVYVGLPDAPARFRLLEIYLGKKPLAPDVEFGEFCDALEGYSGADIRNIAQQAAHLPFLEAIAGQPPRPIGRTDLLSVIDRTPPSVDKGDLTRFEKFTATGD
ncbi:MAG: ATP-dependent zinc metalloprotease FtsH [Phycisphaerae bacterium]|nr:ATP-dependent zinc metalloprotease FtsH [Phycisphaerae bacterium]